MKGRSYQPKEEADKHKIAQGELCIETGPLVVVGQEEPKAIGTLKQ